MKKAVMLMANESVIFALLNMIIQLRRHEYIDGIIVVVDLQDKKEIWRSFLSDLDKRVKVIFFDDLNVTKYLRFDISTNRFVKKYGLMPFSRFCIFECLKEYDSLAMLDVDMLITGRFEELFTSQVCMAWHAVPNNMMSVVVKGAENATYPRGGTIIVNKCILEYCKSPTEEAFSILNKIVTVDHCDELVFGILAFKYKMPIALLDKKYNSYPTELDARGAVIVHALSDYKFWKHPVSRVMFREWEKYNCEVDDLLQERGLKNFSQTLPDAVYNEKNIYYAIDLIELHNMLGGVSEDLLLMRMDVKSGMIRLYPFSDTEMYFVVKKKAFSHLIVISFIDINHTRGTSKEHKMFFSMMFDFWRDRIKVSFSNGHLIATLECLRGEVSSFINRMYYNLQPLVGEYSKIPPDMSAIENIFFRNKMARIRTFHNTWLVLEGDKLLVHTSLSNRNFSQLVYASLLSSKEMLLFVVKNDGVLYLKSIKSDGSVIFSKVPVKFMIIADRKNNYISVCNNQDPVKYLSARSNGILAWVDNNMDWEHYILEYA